MDAVPAVTAKLLHTRNPVMAMDRTLELLKSVSTATITTQLLQRGLRNVFLQGVKPVTPHRMAGPAFTLRYIPAREDIDTLDVFKDYDHPQRKAIETRPARPRPRHGLPRPEAGGVRRAASCSRGCRRDERAAS